MRTNLPQVQAVEGDRFQEEGAVVVAIGRLRITLPAIISVQINISSVDGFETLLLLLTASVGVKPGGLKMNESGRTF